MLHLKSTWILLPLLCVLLFAACDDDEAKEELFIDRLEGQYTGTYEQRDCALFQTVQFSVEDEATADIVKLTDEDVEVTLGAPGLGVFYQFEGTVSSDTSFVIPEFTADDDKVYFGNGFLLEEDRVRVLLSDSCIIFDEARATIVFEGQ